MLEHSQCFILKGTVQEVGMRYMIRREALRLSLTGYAKNLHDGTVEVQLTGSVKAIEALKMWIVTNPGLSKIRQINTIKPQSSLEFVGFDIL